MYSLKQVKEVYSVVGKHPFYYNLMSKIILRRIRKKALEMLCIKKGDSILEVACGTGINIPELEKKVGKEGKIFAVDYVEEMTESAKKLIKKKKIQNVDIIQGDISNLKLTKKFDAVLSIIGLSAVPEHIKALYNINEMLKKNGIFVVLDGKKFDKKWSFLNFLINILRWSKSYDSDKDITEDIKKIFNKVRIEKFYLGSVFIAAAKKQLRTYI